MIKIKTEKEIEIMKEGGRILAGIMLSLEKMVKPGVKTKELNRVASDLVLKYKAKCSFKGYQDFPFCLCTSVNEEIVHCFPSERKLKEGDIISLDFGIYYKGFHTDMAITVPVGNISNEAQKLIEVTKEALNMGIKKVAPGVHFNKIGETIEEYVKSYGYNVIRELCGHGIGKNIHEDPQILNFKENNKGPEIKQGMVFCIEPMVSIGDWRIKKARDGYGFQTRDGSLSCHFEHTIAVTQKGTEILTVF